MLCLLVFIVGANCACDPQHVHANHPSEGFLVSPSYPLPYPPDANCLYNLTAIPGLVIHLSFTNFELEDRLPRSNQCLNDFIVVTVTDRQGKNYIGERYCGNSLPPPIRTMQNRVTIRFRSSNTVQYSGFRLHYQFLHEEKLISYEGFAKKIRTSSSISSMKNGGALKAKNVHSLEIMRFISPTNFWKEYVHSLCLQQKFLFEIMK